LLAIYQLVKNFSREYKYTLGENIKNQTIELLTLIYRANSSQHKADIIQSAREHLEIIRLHVRLTKDLHQINVEKFVFINSNIENVSKQLRRTPQQTTGTGTFTLLNNFKYLR
jgi:hypothetical protein